jgi:hypothetical protein
MLEIARDSGRTRDENGTCLASARRVRARVGLECRPLRRQISRAGSQARARSRRAREPLRDREELAQSSELDSVGEVRELGASS